MKSVKKPYNVLCLEDNDLDQMLLESTLTSAGLDCQFTRTKNKNDFESALAHSKFDIIICDFGLPGYNGLTALDYARQRHQETPFLFLSGSIGEERAIESLKHGATDYVLKDHRDRLIPAVERALRDSYERSERKRLEDQLRQSQKMEAIGQLAGGVAHDFNNILAVIRGNAELATMTGEPIGVQLRECLQQVIDASERAATLTRQLLAFGRKQSIQPRILELNEVIKNLNRMLKRVICENIHLECDFSQAGSVINADPGMMEQVLLNLIVNARDAMPNGGTLTITTGTVTFDRSNVHKYRDARIGEFICLSVTDTGTGIAPDHLPRIFEPFFTTKEVGKGTGLGLATVYGIVKQHQGWIDVSSEVGVGTMFEVFLPAIPAAFLRNAPPAEESAPKRGSETILLVEDDPGVRLSTRQLLENFGYHVIEADSGRNALEVWNRQESTINLLLTDLVMPGGMNGHDLALRLREKSADLKIIFMSGYNLNAVGKDTDFFLRNKNSFIQKPFSARELLHIVRRCLDQTTAIALKPHSVLASVNA